MKKTKICIIAIAVILLAAGAFGIYRLATYKNANHADWISNAERIACNQSVSGKAISTSAIRTDEIALLHTLTKTPGQDSVATFYIYQLPEGADGEDYMSLQADQCSLVYMGTLTCRLVENQLTSAYDLQVTYVR